MFITAKSKELIFWPTLIGAVALTFFLMYGKYENSKPWYTYYFTSDALYGILILFVIIQTAKLVFYKYEIKDT